MKKLMKTNTESKIKVENCYCWHFLLYRPMEVGRKYWRHGQSISINTTIKDNFWDISLHSECASD